MNSKTEKELYDEKYRTLKERVNQAAVVTAQNLTLLLAQHEYRKLYQEIQKLPRRLGQPLYAESEPKTNPEERI